MSSPPPSLAASFLSLSTALSASLDVAPSADHLLSLKRLSRLLLHQLEAKTKLLGRQRQKAERQENELRNLLYEKTHLLREIALCKDYVPGSLKELERAETETEETTTKTTTPMVTEEKPKKKQKAAKAAAKAAAPGAPEQPLVKDENGFKDAATHEANLQAIADVLSKRRELSTQKDEAASRKKAKSEAGQQTLDFLQAIPSHLKAIQQACEPLTKVMGLKDGKADGKSKPQHEEAREKLPADLFVLFAQLAGAGEDVSVVDTPDISRDLAPAMEFLEGHNRAAEEARVFAPSPSSVLLSLPTSVPDEPVHVIFSHLPSLSVVTAFASSSPPPSPTPLPSLFSGLFPADTGAALPNPSAHHRHPDLNAGRGVVLPSPEAMPGRPYAWAQWLAGMYFLTPSLPAPSLEPSTRAVLSALKSRVTSWHAKSQILADVLSLPSAPPPGDGAPRVAAAEESPGPDDSRVLHLSFAAGTTCVDAYVVVTPSYPEAVPEWEVGWGKGGGGFSMELKALQTKLNTCVASEQVLKEQIDMVMEGIAGLKGGREWGEVSGVRVRKGRERVRVDQ